MRIVLFHPRAAEERFRLPLSVLTLASVVPAGHEVVIVDGDLLADPLPELKRQLSCEGPVCLGVSVMPGPQLARAVPQCQALRAEFPRLTIIWGGWFPSLHAETCLASPFVDVVVRGRGELSFPALIQAIADDQDYSAIAGLSFRGKDGKVQHNPDAALAHPDTLPPLPYHLVALAKYNQKTWLGSRTTGYHSSLGCPLKCGFCAVAAQFEGRWLGQSVSRMMVDIEPLLAAGANAIEFFDNNFFVSEKRVVEFAETIKPRGISWWGEGTIDGLMRYRDESLRAMRESGCKMIFFGAESGSDAVLALYNKGGLVHSAAIELAERFSAFDIVPEFSFVLGNPIAPREDIDASIQLVRRLKSANPRCEIILYLYSPEPYQKSALWEAAKAHGFRFPERLEEWAGDAERLFNLRRAPETPWLSPDDLARVRGFETVLNAYSPGVADIRLGARWRRVLHWLAARRYRQEDYLQPRLLQLALRVARHRRVEQEGL